MNKLRRGRDLLIIAIIAVALSVSGIVYGANLFTKGPISSSITIVPAGGGGGGGGGTPVPNPALGVYTESTGTNQVVSIPWNNWAQGQTAIATVYLRNNGNVPFSNITATADLPGTVGNFSTVGVSALAPAEIQPLTLQISVLANAPTQSYPFNVTITAGY